MITRLVAAGIVMAASPVSAGQTDVYGRDLCEVGEKPLFACPLDRKLVSICAGRSKVVYRFGTPSRVELNTPASGFAFNGYSGGGETQVGARAGNVSYTVYTKTVRTAFGEGTNDPASTAGVIVQRGGRTIARLQCTPTPDADIDPKARTLLPSGGFVRH